MPPQEPFVSKYKVRYFQQKDGRMRLILPKEAAQYAIAISGILPKGYLYLFLDSEKRLCFSQARTEKDESIVFRPQ